MTCIFLKDVYDMLDMYDKILFIFMRIISESDAKYE